MFRAYVAAAGDSYAVMPGGLTRVSGARDVPIVSMQRGGGSKDTWVLSDGPVSSMSLLSPPGSRMRPERAGSDLPSRVADNLFWLGRYAERAEHTMRLLRSVVVAPDGSRIRRRPAELSALLRGAGPAEAAAGALRAAGCRFASSKQNVARVLSPDRARTPACAQTLNELRRIATVVRDRLSD